MWHLYILSIKEYELPVTSRVKYKLLDDDDDADVQGKEIKGGPASGVGGTRVRGASWLNLVTGYISHVVEGKLERYS